MSFVKLSCAVINTDDIARIRLLKYPFDSQPHALYITLKNGGYVKYSYRFSADRDRDYHLLVDVLIEKESTNDTQTHG
jgi:hypothetical protein